MMDEFRSFDETLGRQAVKLLRQYTYKPTVRLSIRPPLPGSPGPVLMIQIKVPDSRRQGWKGLGWRASSFVVDLDSRDIADRDVYYDDEPLKNELNPDGRPVSDVVGRMPIPVMLLQPDAEDDFERWLFCQLTDLEIHEAREWFRKDGAIVDDPHNPTGRLS
jgi:hypothetical protein